MTHTVYLKLLSYVPSISVAGDLAKGSVESYPKVLVIGYLGSDLPEVANEITHIRQAWGSQVNVLASGNGNKLAVLNEMQKPYDFIHFSCHGTFDEVDPLSSALHLVPNVEDDSLRITARDLQSIRLTRRPLVTLSACSSGLSSADLGNDLFGLGGGLLRAGARAIVGSRWPVYDTFSRDFTGRLYSEIRQDPGRPFEAFQRTQRSFANGGRLENWASYGYFGV
jgi:CHAT domain-containing protein